MAINDKIMHKINEKTIEDPTLRELLRQLIEYETEGHGWYTKKYKSILESVIREDDNSEI